MSFSIFSTKKRKHFSSDVTKLFRYSYGEEKIALGEVMRLYEMYELDSTASIIMDTYRVDVTEARKMAVSVREYMKKYDTTETEALAVCCVPLVTGIWMGA